MLTILNGSMRPFISPRQYADLSDWQIVNVYLAPTDDDGKPIPMRGQTSDGGDGPTGDPDLAGRELPSAKELELPSDALAYGVPMDFVLMSFQTYRRRGLTAEQATERWRARMRREGRTAE